MYVRSHSQKSKFRNSLPPLIGDKNVVGTYYKKILPCMKLHMNLEDITLSKTS